MTRLWLIVLIPLVITLPVDGQAQSPDAQNVSTFLEQQALHALAHADLNELSQLERMVQRLPAATWRDLSHRIRPGLVEFRFRGRSPGPDSLAILEYVVSSKEKDYESLLVVEEAELKRLQAVGDAVAKLKEKGRPVPMELTLLWTEDGRTRAEDLADVLRTAAPADRARFMQELTFGPAGLLAFNLQGDPAAVPSKPGPAEVRLIVRLPKK